MIPVTGLGGRRKVMRRARIVAESGGYYHCMSRIIEKRPLLNTEEKEVFRCMMRSIEGFSGVKILTYALMANHFHILIYMPPREDISDDELLRRLTFLYDKSQVDLVAATLHDLRAQEQHTAAEDVKKRYTYRMYDISEFFKSLKQRFSQHYNRKTDRSGPLWEQRYKSILVEGSEHALSTIAAYIDLNPVRAHIVQDPKDYPYCGYAEAVGGKPEARVGLTLVMQNLNSQGTWEQTGDKYRQMLYIQGQEKGLDINGRPTKSGFTRKEVEDVLQSGGKLPMHVLLRCRIRYFSDGLVLGSKEFTEDIFVKHRVQFGSKRKTGTRSMKSGNWGDLYTLRDLRKNPVSIS